MLMYNLCKLHVHCDTSIDRASYVGLHVLQWSMYQAQNWQLTVVRGLQYARTWSGKSGSPRPTPWAPFRRGWALPISCSRGIRQVRPLICLWCFPAQSRHTKRRCPLVGWLWLSNLEQKWKVCVRSFYSSTSSTPSVRADIQALLLLLSSHKSVLSTQRHQQHTQYPSWFILGIQILWSDCETESKDKTK